MSSFVERVRKTIAENQELFLALEELDRTGKLPRITYKTRENFTIDADVMNKFRSYCTRNNIKMSNKVEELLREFLREKR